MTIHCPICRGRGGIRSPAGWHRCQLCNPRMSRAAREAQQTLHATGSRFGRQLSLDELLKESNR